MATYRPLFASTRLQGISKAPAPQQIDCASSVAHAGKLGPEGQAGNWSTISLCHHDCTNAMLPPSSFCGRSGMVSGRCVSSFVRFHMVSSNVETQIRTYVVSRPHSRRSSATSRPVLFNNIRTGLPVGFRDRTTGVSSLNLAAEGCREAASRLRRCGNYPPVGLTTPP